MKPNSHQLRFGQSRRKPENCSRILKSSDRSEIAIVIVYCALNACVLTYLCWHDPFTCWEKYGDTPEFWGRVLVRMEWCQLMIAHPFVVMAGWIVVRSLLRKKLDVCGIFIVSVIVLIEVVNVVFCWADALGVEV